MRRLLLCREQPQGCFQNAKYFHFSRCAAVFEHTFTTSDFELLLLVFKCRSYITYLNMCHLMQFKYFLFLCCERTKLNKTDVHFRGISLQYYSGNQGAFPSCRCARGGILPGQVTTTDIERQTIVDQSLKIK